jgi:vacuolar-type H+-ATPase subunit B/Vma2
MPTSCEVLLQQYSFGNFGKYDEPYMITVTKRILESEKISKQQYITIIVVLSDNTNYADILRSIAVSIQFCEFW